MLEPARKEERFEEQLGPLMGLLYRYALRLTRNADGARDLVQDACLKAYQRLGQLKEVEKFRPWILKIMYTTFADQRRKFSKQVDKTSLDESFVPGSRELKEERMEAVANPEDEMLRRELGGKIKEALEGLPEEYRLPVFLAYSEGLSYEEVATALDCPVGTVMSRLYRGRKLLREKLETYGPFSQ